MFLALLQEKIEHVVHMRLVHLLAEPQRNHPRQQFQQMVTQAERFTFRGLILFGTFLITIVVELHLRYPLIEQLNQVVDIRSHMLRTAAETRVDRLHDLVTW